jgi:leader peptidase (prepilin peptidase) / N-methyltransferase
VPPIVAILLAVAGGGWGLASDRIAVRWPEHDEEFVAGRAPGWRTVACVVIGAAALGGVALRYTDPVAAAVTEAYAVALVLLLATDLDQRLLPNVITYPAIPVALAVTVLGLNPAIPVTAIPIAIAVTLAIDGLLFLFSVPFGVGAIGLGDLKLLLSAGIVLGGYGLITTVVRSALLAGVVIVVLLVTRRVGLRDFVPYGPFIIVGVLWTLLGGG